MQNIYLQKEKIVNQQKCVSTKYCVNINQNTEQKFEEISYKCINKHC